MVPRQGRRAAGVHVETEQETDGGWIFTVRVGPEESAREHRVRLSWVDYEYWSHGASSPSRILEGVLAALAEVRPAAEWPESFDAATARRWAPDLDERVRGG